MELDSIEMLKRFEIDCYNHHMYINCTHAQCKWNQRFEEGATLEELVIAAVSHYDKVHGIERE